MNRLILMCGYPFSGKTVLAKKLVDKFGFERVDIDEIIVGHGFISFDDPKISKERMKEMFGEYYKTIENCLKSGKTVISDTSNPSRSGRAYLRRIAEKYGCSTVVLLIDTSVSTIKERWNRNKSEGVRMHISEKTLEEAFLEMEKPDESEGVVVYKGNLLIDEWIELNKNLF